MVHLCSRPLAETRGKPVQERYHIHADDVPPLAARARDGDPEARLARGRVPAPRPWRLRAGGRCRRPGPARAPGRADPGAAAASRTACRRSSSGCARPHAERLFSADGAPRRPASLRTRIPRLAVRARACRPPAGAMSASPPRPRSRSRPDDYQHFAGLIAWYGRFKFHYLAVTADEEGERLLTVYSCAADWPDARVELPVDADPSARRAVRSGSAATSTARELTLPLRDGRRLARPRRRARPVRDLGRGGQRARQQLHRRLRRHVRARHLGPRPSCRFPHFRYEAK